MANKNDRMVVAYYHNEDAAAYAAEELKLWDKANADIKLGAVAIVTLDPKTGELEANEVGQRKTKGGALWGTALGAVAGLMTGGLALVPAVLVGAGGGSAVGRDAPQEGRDERRGPREDGGQPAQRRRCPGGNGRRL